MQAHRISRRTLDRARSRRPDQQPEQAPVPIAVIPVRRSPNLEVGASNDPVESDADRLATQALSRLSIESDPGALGPGSAGGPDAHRHGPDCEHVARRAPASTLGTAGGTLDEATSEAIERVRGAGMPLPTPTLRRMEAAFGATFSDVRVHAGGRATELNRAVSARAFTTGADIFFGAGAYEPGNPAGDHVLAHELGHVVQSRSHAARRSGPRPDGAAGLSRTLRRIGPAMFPPAKLPPAKTFPAIQGIFQVPPGALDAKLGTGEHPDAEVTGSAEADGHHLLELKGDPMKRIKAGSRFKIDMIETRGSDRIVHLSGIGGSGSERMIARYRADGKEVTAPDHLARLDSELVGARFEVDHVSGTPRAGSAQTFVQLTHI
jgi:hypothetical protein